MSDDKRYSEDELVAPSFLDKLFFENILRKIEEDPVEIEELKIRPGSEVGDHYASVMFRAILTYQIGGKKISRSFIIKTMPVAEGKKKDHLAEQTIFDTEDVMYTEMMPLLHKELRAMGDNTVLGCQCYHAAHDPHEVIVLEDISPLGYKPVRNEDYSLDIAFKTIEKLAKWHAASYKLDAEGNTEVNKLTKSFYADEKTGQMPFFKESLDCFEDTLNADEDLKKYLPQYFKLKATNPLEVCQKNMREFGKTGARVSVLTHGDIHIKNIMFKEVAGKFEDVLLIDFQNCHWAPAALDLIYVLYTLVDSETRLNRRDEVIHFYYEHFSKTLKGSGFKGTVPELADFFKDITIFRHFELLMLVCVRPIVLRPKVCSPEMALHDDEFRRGFYRYLPYVEEVKKAMPSFLDSGCFQ